MHQTIRQDRVASFANAQRHQVLLQIIAVNRGRTMRAIEVPPAVYLKLRPVYKRAIHPPPLTKSLMGRETILVSDAQGVPALKLHLVLDLTFPLVQRLRGRGLHASNSAGLLQARVSRWNRPTTAR